MFTNRCCGVFEISENDAVEAPSNGELSWQHMVALVGTLLPDLGTNQRLYKFETSRSCFKLKSDIDLQYLSLGREHLSQSSGVSAPPAATIHQVLCCNHSFAFGVKIVEQLCCRHAQREP